MTSLRASVRSLSHPLFDGNVSVKARQLLARGDPVGAIDEYRRLASLGSAKARCVLAYAHLVGSALTPKDVAVARTMAASAASGEPGYSNYVLGFVDVVEGDYDSGLAHFIASRKAGFLPAHSAAAQLYSNLYQVAERDRKICENLFIKAMRAGHAQAYLLLAAYYLKGNRGWMKRIAGAVLYPIALLYFYLSLRLGIFSISTFTYHPTYKDLFKRGPTE